MEAQMGAPDFWDSNDRAQKHIAKLNGLKKTVNPVVAFRRKVDDLTVLLEFAETADAGEKEGYEQELESTTKTMLEELDALEIASFLTERFDNNNAIFSIQAGAGGTESNDYYHKDTSHPMLLSNGELHPEEFQPTSAKAIQPYTKHEM